MKLYCESMEEWSIHNLPSLQRTKINNCVRTIEQYVVLPTLHSAHEDKFRSHDRVQSVRLVSSSYSQSKKGAHYLARHVTRDARQKGLLRGRWDHLPVGRMQGGWHHYLRLACWGFHVRPVSSLALIDLVDECQIRGT